MQDPGFGRALFELTPHIFIWYGRGKISKNKYKINQRLRKEALTMLNKNLIKTLDLHDFFAGGKIRSAFLQDLKDAVKYPGFFFLKNHGINQESLLKMEELCNQFFEFSPDIKLAYEDKIGKHQRGYTPPRIETGEFFKLPDEKEFLQLGGDNAVDIKEIPEFLATHEQVFEQYMETYYALLRASALAFDLPEDTFLSKEGNSIMRAINYLPSENPLQDEGAVHEGGNVVGMCASKHTDLNFITLLFAQKEGLQLECDGEFMPIHTDDPNIIIVNTGDMFQHITNGEASSGVHRVVCKKNTRRLVLIFFGHLRPDASIAPLECFGPAQEKFHFITAGELLEDRLSVIKL